MSWQACTWAEAQQIVTRPSDRHVLIILANYADAEGRNAFPAIARLARGTGYTDRAIQKILRRLEEAGAIRPGDQRIAEVHIERADRRPTVYDLALETVEKAGERGEPRSPRDRDGVNENALRGERRDTNGVNGGSPDKSYKNILETRAREGGDPDGPPSPGAKGRAASGVSDPNEGGSDREGDQGNNRTAGHGGEGGGLSKDAREQTKRGLTEREHLLMAQRTVITDWLTGSAPFAAVLKTAGLKPDLSRDELDAAVTGLDPVALNAVCGLIRWAHRLLHADPAVRAPRPPVIPIIRALSNPETKPLTQWRCARLLGAPFLADERPANFGEVYRPGEGNGGEGGDAPGADESVADESGDGAPPSELVREGAQNQNAPIRARASEASPTGRPQAQASQDAERAEGLNKTTEDAA